jgi:uncharacterized protein YkwD
MALVVSLAASMVLGAVVVPAANASPVQDRMLSILNRIRQNHDLRSLRVTPSLTDETKTHTRKMIRKGLLFDPRNLAEILEPYAWNDVGVDVVGCHDSLTKMVHQWMGEEFHRSIILHPKLRRAGIGIRRVDGKSACGRDQYWAAVVMYG